MDALAKGPVETALVDAPKGKLIVPAIAASGPSVRLSIVLPTFNEAKNIAVIIGQLSELFEPVVGDAYEIIVVDDDSPDRTWQVALDVAKTNACVRVVRRQGERGLSTAVIRGWQVARGEVIGVMDADLQQ